MIFKTPSKRWFTHSEFSHKAHIRATKAASTAENKNPCETCHSPALAASKSTQTADVLLPGIDVCQECHTSAGKARSACVTCHTYHLRPNQERARFATEYGKTVY
jgi:predicted CXXCH cytochrome family protein